MKKAILLWVLCASFISSVHAKNINDEEVLKKESKYPTYQIIGFAQLQFIEDESSESGSDFLIKRIRLGVSGKVAKDVGYNLSMGGTEPPDRDPQLVNAFIDLNYIPKLKVRVGQFFVPFGLEGPQPIFTNPAIERSTAIQKLNPFNMFRDVGVGLSDGGELGKLTYAVAIVSGEGANQAKDGNEKDVLGRIGFEYLAGLNFGISGHQGTFSSGAKDLERFRYGLDFEYHIARWQLRGEYISRSDEQVVGVDLDSQGWYLLAGYNIKDNIVGIARYEQYRPDVNISNNMFSATTLGFNYIFSKNNRVSVNYEFRDDAAKSNIDNRLTVQLQIVL